MIKKKNSLFKNVSLIILSTLFLVLSVLGFIINIDIKNKTRDLIFADTTTTNFYGSSFYVPVNTYYYDMDYTWNTKTWTGLTSFQGIYTWSDGTNYYYSNGSLQMVLDVSTSTWTAMTWNGALTAFEGINIWSDGSNFYYSGGNNIQYVLDVSTSTWTAMTWTGFNRIIGSYIWFLDNHIYYSNSNQQWELDVSTNTWTTKTWYGALTAFEGMYTWSDGTNYYYSNGSLQKVLDVSTSTWSDITWTGLNETLNSAYIYNIADNTYYLHGNFNCFVLDKVTLSWYTIVWNGYNNFAQGYYTLWNIGDIYYYSNNNQQWQLDTTKQFIKDYDNTYFVSMAYTFIDNVTDYKVYSNAVVYSYDTNGQVKYSVSDKMVIAQSLVSDTDVLKIYNNSNYVDYDTFNYSTGITKYYYIPFEMFNKYNVKITACFRFQLQSTNGVSDLNFNSIKFDSGYISPILNVGTITNKVRYSASDTSKFLEFVFDCYSYGDTPVYYFGDSSQVITYYLGFTDGRPTNDNYYFRFNPRTYYLTVSSGDSYNAGYIAGDTAGYNRGYSAGETAGYGTGYSDGETVGYSDGYNAGDTAGYNRGYTTGYNTGDSAGYYRGYNDGGNAANTYTFLGLISAVIDAPIKAFTGLFNFNLLGVNMVSFITALFTLAVIVTIIKKVI